LANQDLIDADKLPANIDWLSNFSLSKEFLVSQIDSIIVDAANIKIKLK
jgi:hypothetical protein